MDFNNSRIQENLTCPMKFRHRYIRKIVPTKSAHYFVLGSAMHKFIEMFYRTKDAKLSLRQVEEIFSAVDRAPLNREETHELEVDRNIATGIAAAYPAFYKQDFDEFSKFLTEQKFRIKLPNGHFWFGTIDALLLDHAGDWWILETKTASPQTIGDSYFERVKIDSQVTGYMHGAKAMLGFFPRGVIYNVIKKPSIRLKNGESLAQFQRRIYEEYTKFAKEKQYFIRQQLEVAKHRLAEWEENITAATSELAAKIEAKSKFWIKNTGACNAYYGTCPYMNACVTGEYNRLLYKKEENPV